MAQPRLIGAFVGLLLLSCLEFLAIPIRLWVQARFPLTNSPLSLTLGLFVMLGFLKAWIFGVIIGQSCGFAASQWISRNRAAATATLQKLGINIVLFYAVFFSIPLFSVALQAFISTVPLAHRLNQTLEWGFATVPLQIAVGLWLFSRFLSDHTCNN